MTAAEALAVPRIEARAAIHNFNYVVGKHSVIWLAPGAAFAVLFGFATSTGPSNHSLAPRPMFRREIDIVSCLRLMFQD
jgi:hypothetical protein